MTVKSDDFNRADENPLAGSWTTIPGWGALKISGNKVMNAGSGNSGAFWNADSIGAEQYSQVAGSTLTRPVVRCSAAATTFYMMALATTSVIRVYKCITGTLTQLGADIAYTYGAGKTAKLKVSGTTLTIEYDGVTLDTRTDSAIATGQPACSVYGLSAWLDNWEGGDLTGATKCLVDGFDSRMLTGGLL